MVPSGAKAEAEAEEAIKLKAITVVLEESHRRKK